MALISATTILTSLSLFHITLGFFFLTSPMTIADQALVWMLGQSMGMPYERSFEAQSPALAFAAVLLAMIGLTDIITLSMPEEVALVHHWGAQGMLDFPPFSALYFFFSFPFSCLLSIHDVVVVAVQQANLTLLAAPTNPYSTPPLPLLLRPLGLRLPLQRLLPLVPRGRLCARQVAQLARLVDTRWWRCRCCRRCVQPVRLGRRFP